MTKNYTYYFTDNDDNIVVYDTDKTKVENTLKFMPQYADSKVKSTTKEIVLLDGKPVFAADHEAEIAHQAEQEAEQKAYEDNQKAILAIKSDLLTATLMGDDEWIEELKADYLALTEGAEDE